MLKGSVVECALYRSSKSDMNNAMRISMDLIASHESPSIRFGTMNPTLGHVKRTDEMRCSLDSGAGGTHQMEDAIGYN